mgnify:FL=1
MIRPTASTVIFGALVLLGFALAAVVLLPVSGVAWSVAGADNLFYHYLSEFF